MSAVDTDRRVSLDAAVAAGLVSLINPKGSPRGHILSRHDFLLPKNRAKPRWTLCGKRYHKYSLITRSDFNMSACGRCSLRFKSIDPEDLTLLKILQENVR